MKTEIPFEKLGKRKKRVALAQDVIYQLNKKRIKAGSCYIRLPWEIERKIENAVLHKIPTSLQKLLLETSVPCIVCAKGALFISHITKANNFDVTSSCITVGSIMQETNEFSTFQLNLIECAYERWNHSKGVKGAGQKILKRAYLFGMKYIDIDSLERDRECLIGIMQNIIDNNGTFKP